MVQSKKEEGTFKLASTPRTKEEAYMLQRKLEEVVAGMRKSEKGGKTMADVLTVAEKKLLLEDLESSNVSPDKSAALPVINRIIDAIKVIPVVTLELSFRPSASFVEEMYEVINTQIKGHFLIDSKYKPDIGGGVIIYYQGRRHNYSIKEKLNEIEL